MGSLQILNKNLQSFSSFGEPVLWHGIDEAPRTFLIGVSLLQEKKQDVLILCENEKRMKYLADFIRENGITHEIMLFPNNEVIPFEVLAQSDDMAVQRASVLNTLVQPHSPKVILTTADAFFQRLLPENLYTKDHYHIELGDQVDFKALSSYLAHGRYRFERDVRQAGEVSIRGGIIDVFVPGQESPTRIEFFDDEIDSMRYFDPETQRSTGSCEQLTILPAKEYFIPEDKRDVIGQKLEDAVLDYARILQGNGLNTQATNIKERVLRIASDIKSGIENDNIGLFSAYYGIEKTALLQYLSEDAILIVDEFNRIEDGIEANLEERQQHFSSLQKKGHVLPKQWEYYFSPDEMVGALEGRRLIAFSLLKRKSRYLPDIKSQSLSTETIFTLNNDFKVILEQFQYWIHEGYRIICSYSDEKRKKNFEDFCDSYRIPIRDISSEAFLPGVYLSKGHSSENAIFLKDKLVCFSIQPAYNQNRHKAKKTENSISSPDELKKGDYVVHENHGIGKYQGIVHVDTGDIKRDYLLVQYAGTDKLYVPIDQFGLLQRYGNPSIKRPRMNKLSGTEWQRTKSKVKASVEYLAEDLLKIYAKRKSMPGHAFAPDSPLQAEFEKNFPYVETEDQLQAIEDVKKDMESQSPMDRLVCGDVGYGKTEVALRAAFKAVCDGKQVAILVPTTILAQQHAETFHARLDDYAVNIELLSRFVSGKKEKEIFQKIKDKQVDIVIGTHKILNKKIKFADLGLLIIDEEQRFGVTHKERIKEMRSQVDVLTLTATPIPRTLHMSLVGIRDMSLIETPPDNRYPIQTYVIENQDIVIEQAIRREMARGGQIFIVYNKIDDMEKVIRYYRELVPEARIISGHGRMSETHLEDVFLTFTQGQADILISTTIIETGIDMPNVNTMIVLNADHMGLSQLYQLRGRIGRSNRVAYAYLTYEKDKTMTEKAEKRLQTLKDYTALGSGYRIAMKDLELRGAGNLLGAEQHGNVADVGFDIYMTLLQEAVERLKGEAPEKVPFRPEIELSINAYIPEGYISDDVLRLQCYQRLERCERKEELDELFDEILDRFGDMPNEVIHLFMLIEIKLLAIRLDIRSVKQKLNTVQLAFRPEASYDVSLLMKIAREYPRKVKITNAAGELMVVLLFQSDRLDRKSLDSIKVLLKSLSQDCHQS